jgi:hypothetical protein
MQLLKVLPSKIAQIDGPNALCEDGSVWTYVETGRQWAEVHPPHKPPPVFDDLKEALRALKNLLWCANPHGFPEPSATTEAKKLLVKHGAY